MSLTKQITAATAQGLLPTQKSATCYFKWWTRTPLLPFYLLDSNKDQSHFLTVHWDISHRKLAIILSTDSVNLVFPLSYILHWCTVLKILRTKSEEWWAKEKQRRSYLGKCFYTQERSAFRVPCEFLGTVLSYLSPWTGIHKAGPTYMRFKAPGVRSSNIQCHQHRLSEESSRRAQDIWTQSVKQITTAWDETKVWIHYSTCLNHVII